ncbi:hypothetical protein O3P69_002249 [Scylla paramamosain]|uniref:ATP-dependent DNA ligase family profile domain-containing protein n=1 Tax=Scylla paramamosain TaxID=85552 RepID=A0AAW0V7G9_SCYPA
MLSSPEERLEQCRRETMVACRQVLMDQASLVSYGKTVEAGPESQQEQIDNAKNQIKYNGERVQVHKKENRFIFFTRAIKSVAEHKVEDMKEYVVDTFPEAETINAEMLMICKKTGKPLPFGAMGKNKRRRLCQQLPV